MNFIFSFLLLWINLFFILIFERVRFFFFVIIRVFIFFVYSFFCVYSGENIDLRLYRLDFSFWFYFCISFGLLKSRCQDRIRYLGIYWGEGRGRRSRVDFQIICGFDIWRKREGRKIVWEVVNCSIERKVLGLGLWGVFELKVFFGGIICFFGRSSYQFLFSTFIVFICWLGEVKRFVVLEGEWC